jgi:hypothetical protein
MVAMPHIPAKPIAMTHIDFESDQQLIQNTVVADGKWRFEVDGELIAEADAPAEATREILEMWCGAIRKRIRGKQELNTEEMMAAREANRRGTAQAIAIPDGVDDPREEQPVQEPVATVDDDPDAFVKQKVKTLRAKLLLIEEERDRLIDESASLSGQLAKWERMLESDDA